MNILILYSMIGIICLSESSQFQNSITDFSSLEWPCAKLKWSDFRASPSIALRDSNTSNYYALSSVRVSIRVSDDTQLKVKVIFDRDKSWVKDSTFILSDELLMHEQLHFDISELCARKIRLRVSQINDKESIADLLNDKSSSLSKDIAYLLKERSNNNTLYDEESDHGTIVEQQKKWDNRIKYELAKLAYFKSMPEACK